MLLQYDNPLNDLGRGFQDALYGSRTYTWEPLYTAILAVYVLVFLLSSKWFRTLFTGRWSRSRARRNEEKKSAFLRKMIFSAHQAGDAETELLKRLTTYYSLNPDPVGMPATPEQLLHFSKGLFRLMHRLQYDARGRLVIPELEKELEENVRMGLDRRKKLLLEWKGVVLEHESKSAPEEIQMSRAARVALNLIRMNKPPAEI